MLGTLALLSLHRATNGVAKAAAPLIAGNSSSGLALAEAIAQLRDEIDGLADCPPPSRRPGRAGGVVAGAVVTDERTLSGAVVNAGDGDGVVAVPQPRQDRREDTDEKPRQERPARHGTRQIRPNRAPARRR